MAKNRTIVRTYWSKKKGEFVTKVYEYKAATHKSTRGRVLVGVNGKLNKKNYEDFKAAITANVNYTEAEKRTLIADLNATIKQRQLDKKKLTTSGFLGKQESDETKRFLANLGYSADELAEELSIDESDILDPNNWENGILNVNGERYKFEFTYSGQIYEKLR